MEGKGGVLPPAVPGAQTGAHGCRAEVLPVAHGAAEGVAVASGVGEVEAEGEEGEGDEPPSA
eukprot:2365156-Alexandrium_andersonii.AAC.1